MKKLIKIFLPLLFVFFAFYSCDTLNSENGYYVRDTISGNQTGNDTDEIVKKTLLVDFTGIRCVNCPEAHEIIEQIEAIHPGQIVAVAFHVTSLAYPIGDYETDLRTDEGNEIASTFGISEIPVGLVDAFDKTQLQSRENWAAIVDTCVTKDPQVGIDINYSLSDSTLSIDLKIKSLTDLQADPLLCVYLLEDSIITRQATTEAPGYIENYVQMNVFRKSVTNVWGDQISGLTNTGSEVTMQYTTTLSSDYNFNHCKIVAFLKNSSNFVLNAQVSGYVTK